VEIFGRLGGLGSLFVHAATAANEQVAKDGRFRIFCLDGLDNILLLLLEQPRFVERVFLLFLVLFDDKLEFGDLLSLSDQFLVIEFVLIKEKLQKDGIERFQRMVGKEATAPPK
jgi:hypothetical protein